jgi:hypothetical protein
VAVFQILQNKMKKLFAIIATPIFALNAQIEVGAFGGASLYTGEASIFQTPNFRGTQNSGLYNPLDANWSLAMPTGGLFVSAPVTKNLNLSYRLENLYYKGDQNTGAGSDFPNQPLIMTGSMMEQSLLMEIRLLYNTNAYFTVGVSHGIGRYNIEQQGTNKNGTYTVWSAPVGLRFDAVNIEHHHLGILASARYTQNDNLDGLQDLEVVNNDAYYSFGLYYSYTLEKGRPHYKAPKKHKTTGCYTF